MTFELTPKTKRTKKKKQENRKSPRQLFLSQKGWKMSSTHVRRSVRVSTAPKAFTYVTKEKKELIWSGSGIELSTVPCIVAKIKNTLARDAALKQIHSLMYRRVGSAKEAKKNILKFNGFNKEDLMNEHFLERVAQKMKKFSLANLKKIYDTLCLNRSSGTFGKTPTKDQLIERLTEWLAEPTVCIFQIDYESVCTQSLESITRKPIFSI